MEAESLLEEKPELKEELDGLLSVYEISIRQNGGAGGNQRQRHDGAHPDEQPSEGLRPYQAVRVDGEPERIEAKAEDGSLVFEAGGPGRYAVLRFRYPLLRFCNHPTRPVAGRRKAMETPSTSFCWPRYRRLSCWRCCLYSYTGKSGRHRITRQPEEDPSEPDGGDTKTDSTCKGENEDVSKKSLLALLLSLCMVVGILPATVFAGWAICAGKSPLVGIWKPGNVG